MTMNSSEQIDRAALERLRDLGGPAFVRQMIGLFLDFAPKKLEAARAAERAGDVDGIQKSIHPLRSSSGNVGAVAMQELAARIDQLCRNQQADEVPALLPQIERLFEQAREQLEKELNAEES